MEITIGGVSFNTKTKALEFFQKLLHETKVGESITCTEHVKMLRSLVDRHHDAKNKIGTGVRSFIVMKPESQSPKCFGIIREDGSKVDFSYVKALTGKVPDKESEVKGAFRNTINYQIQEFKNTQPASLRSTTDADHIGTPFRTILKNFLTLNRIDLEDVEIVQGANGAAYRIKDGDLSAKWCAYHKQNATLDPKDRDVHRSKDGQQIKTLNETWLFGSQKLTPKVYTDDTTF